MTPNRTYSPILPVRTSRLQGRRWLRGLATANYSLLTANSSHTFSAKEKDSETGLSYFGARYYSSDLSIWLSVDPMSDYYPEYSPYIFCGNNPVLYIDEFGTDFINFIFHFSQDPPQKKNPQEPNSKDNPYEIDEVVITPDPLPNTSSKRENTSSRTKSKSSILTFSTPIVLENVFERINTVVINPCVAIIFSFAILLQGDSSPTQYEKSNGKNEQHGDGGRALEKADKQIKDLEKQYENSKSRVERQRIRKKIDRIRKDAQRKRKGENHSNGNKR